jgi:hypothetical protein
MKYFIVGPISVNVIGEILDTSDNFDISIDLYKSILFWIKLPCFTIPDLNLGVGSW